MQHSPLELAKVAEIKLVLNKMSYKILTFNPSGPSFLTSFASHIYLKTTYGSTMLLRLQVGPNGLAKSDEHHHHPLAMIILSYLSLRVVINRRMNMFLFLIS